MLILVLCAGISLRTYEPAGSTGLLSTIVVAFSEFKTVLLLVPLRDHRPLEIGHSVACPSWLIESTSVLLNRLFGKAAT